MSDKSVGRPKIEFDLAVVEELAAIQCTQSEMAAVLKCSVDTLSRRMKDDPEFAETIKRGKENGKASLRRLQWRSANNGDRTMLIWLGKQYLGQRDRTETEFKDVTPLIIQPADD